MNTLRSVLASALAALVALPAAAADAPGADRAAFALTGARVILSPGHAVDDGVVIVRGGVIEAVGPAGSTPVPADARVFDAKGKVIHAAYLDPYVPTDRLAGKGPKKPPDEEESPGTSRRARGASTAAPVAHADGRAIDDLTVKDSVADGYRRMGFAVVAAVPASGVLRGRGAVVNLADGPIPARVLDAASGQYVALEPETDGTEYPVSKMGAVAMARQAFLDASWWREASAAYAAQQTGRARPRYDASVAALVPAAQGQEVVVFEADDVLALLRAERVAKEMKLKARYVGAGDEYRLLSEVTAAKPALILRVDFPQPDKVDREEEWLDVPLSKLRAFDRAASNPKWLRDAGLEFSLTTAGLDDPKDFPKRVREAMARGLSADDALAAVTTIPARQLGLADRLGTLAPGKIANLVVETGEPFAEKSRVAEIWIDGARTELRDESKRKAKPEDSSASAAAPGAPDVRPAPAREAGPVAAPSAVVVRGATVWTQGAAGILENADVLVVRGKITAVGKNLTVPAGALEIDGRGKHVTPGIIDAHSHSAVDGSVNEWSANVVAQVRIRDVLNPQDVAIYRELAGGTTIANVLHGSADTIGGQTQIVKLRWGGGPDDLVFVGAPEGIKFALGENPKQSNWSNPHPRYPRTRMGVAETVRERFQAAQEYRKRQEEYRKAAAVKGAHPVPPEPDLQLEAIAEILAGTRKIHCHSYRKDEMLQMLRSAEEFGVQVGTLQHALEGYKIADEIARHGAGASGFSDWWNYKFEVIDAIPYAFPLMHDRGVVVSYNSDSDELARRLNFEASKAVKYGRLEPADALAFVTSNPAKQLGIADRVGSLEVGKDGDFVIWSGDPLSTSSMALETWIDGKKYFDRASDLAARPALEAERDALVAKAKAKLDEGKPSASKGEKPAGSR
jgi:imidazolonepropionase-like amidohydrolase